jgi:hypothetical protein
MAVFAGLDRAHGEYDINAQKGNKLVGKANTKKAPVTKELWQKHLDGKKAIGIIPIRDDSTVVFGAIDIDSYENFDPASISIKVADNQWPLVVCRSKSGGAHVFLFTSEPVPSRLLRSKLKEYAVAIGYPTAEIFPKQDQMFDKEDIGNWINMPYFGGDESNRYAMDNGDQLTMIQFLTFVKNTAISKKELERVEISSNEFSDAPPCLEQLTATGFPAGSLNNALFNMAVYARMKFGEDWHKYVYEYNERFMGPGTSSEVYQIIKSVDKKKYTYKCAEAPICGVCNKLVCSQRKFSPIGEHSTYKSQTSQRTSRPCILDEVELPVRCFEPPENSDDEPYWVFKLQGQHMDVSIDMIQSQLKFIRAYLKRFHKMILPVDDIRWARVMNNILDTAEVEQLAPDAGPEGQLFLHLEAFCNGKAQARVKDELVSGRPWHDDGRVFFRSNDLMKYLETNRFKDFSERQLYAIFRRHGADHHKFMIKGKCVACWSMPSFDQHVGELDIPVITDDRF